MRPLALFFAVLLPFIQPSYAGAPDIFPVRYAENIAWLTLFQNEAGRLNFHLFHDEKGEAVAGSCADLWRLADLGYYARYQEAINREIEFRNGCRMLAVLDGAKASQKSYLQDFKWTEDIIRNLPKGLAESLGALNDAGIHAEFEKNQTFLEAFATYSTEEGQYSLVIKSPNNFEMVYDERTSKIYQIIAFADFNNDGIEDMLLNWVEYPGGSLHLFGHEVLTRLTAKSDLEIIEIQK